MQKKSTLNPKTYLNGLQSLLRALSPDEVINTENVAKYYGCPSLAPIISNLQTNAKDFSFSATIAAVHLIGQKTKLSKVFGTPLELSSLWAQPADQLKHSASLLKPFIDSGNEWRELEKMLSEELKLAQKLKSAQLRAASQRPSATAAKRSLNSSPVKKSKVSQDSIDNQTYPSINHPLMLFNCSCSGPAFGLLIYQ